MNVTVWGMVALLGLSAACGSSSSEATGSGSLADTFCTKIEPCCASDKLPTDGTTCQALFAADSAGTTPTAACIAALQAESQDAFCMDLGQQLPACRSSFHKSGSAQPGAACANDDDCASSSAGTVSCVLTGTTGASVCVVEMAGIVGSTPCIGTVTPLPGGEETVFTTNGGAPAAQSYLCSTGDGVYCDSASSTCLAVKETGASCESDGECVPADACAAAVCAPRAAVGAACSGDTSCVSTAYCDGTTCATLLADGAACTTDDACSSGSCESSVCTSIGAGTLTLFCGSATGGN